MSKAQGIGYVKLWRSIKDWQWYADVPVRTLFIHLLVEANWEAKTWKGQPLAPGQFITSTVTLARDMDTSRASIHRSLSKLKSTGEVDIQTNNHWTLVTVANWEKWQGSGETSERPLRHKRTSGERQAGTTKEEKKLRIEEESIEARRERFIRDCKAVVDANPSRLPDALRKEFFAYWTEPNASGKMRFEDQEFFDHGRRMDTWRKRAEKSGDIPGVPKPEQVVLNANGKPQQLKPWVT